MTIWDLFILALIIIVIGSVALWIIQKFCPAEYQVITRAVVGLALLIFLISQFLPPEAGGYHVWKAWH